MSHFYNLKGEPCHFIESKNGTSRPSTVRDCRKHGWLPSPTTILRLLEKPALNEWKVRQAVMSVVSDPDRPGETIDQKVSRVLDREAQHEEEAKIARDVGEQLHDAIRLALEHKEYDSSFQPFVTPVYLAVTGVGTVMETEKVLVGDGYAGKTDCLTENPEMITVIDFKTCKECPKAPWLEHRLQAAAYAGALGNTGDKRIQAAVCYISKVKPGEIAFHILEDWQNDYKAFRHLLEFWRITNGMDT